MLVWLENIKQYLKCQKGQGMVEYVLILAAIAVGCMVAYGLLGDGIEAAINKVNTELKK